MRAIILAVLVAVGIGLAAGASTVSAAPINGAAIGENASHDNNLTKVQHWRYRSGRRGGGGHWRWGSRGYGGGGCHVRGWSRWRC
jgi:hypothetical protein